MFAQSLPFPVQIWIRSFCYKGVVGEVSGAELLGESCANGVPTGAKKLNPTFQEKFMLALVKGFESSVLQGVEQQCPHFIGNGN